MDLRADLGNARESAEMYPTSYSWLVCCTRQPSRGKSGVSLALDAGARHRMSHRKKYIETGQIFCVSLAYVTSI